MTFKIGNRVRNLKHYNDTHWPKGHEFIITKIDKNSVEGLTACQVQMGEILLNDIELVNNNSVDHPEHYGGANNPYEAIKVIEAWNLNFNIGNTVKYLSRAGKKDPTKHLEDMKKAKWYLEREIEKLTK